MVYFKRVRLLIEFFKAPRETSYCCQWISCWNVSGWWHAFLDLWFNFFFSAIPVSLIFRPGGDLTGWTYRLSKIEKWIFLMRWMNLGSLAILGLGNGTDYRQTVVYWTNASWFFRIHSRISFTEDTKAKPFASKVTADRKCRVSKKNSNRNNGSTLMFQSAFESANDRNSKICIISRWNVASSRDMISLSISKAHLFPLSFSSFVESLKSHGR